MADETKQLGSMRVAAGSEPFERAIGALMEAVGPELARRRRQYQVLGVISEWERPMLIAAGVLLALSVGILLRSNRQSRSETEQATLAQAVGIDPALAEWAAGGKTPPVTSLVLLTWRDQ